MSLPSSRGVMTSGRQASSSTTPMSCLVWRNSGLWLSTPSRDTWPPSRARAFISSFRVVDLPAPFSPHQAQDAPGGEGEGNVVQGDPR